MKTPILLSLALFCGATQAEPEYFARFKHNNTVSYGQVMDNTVLPISGSPFEPHQPVGDAIDLAQVELLLPSESPKVFAVGMNFASHISSQAEAPPPLFLKLPSSLIVSGRDIELPEDAQNVHFEGELVLIIGQESKHISEAEAEQAIFAVSVGNDLTERSWQGRDLQWMRSKAADGFGPISPLMAVGVDYNNVQLTTRLNGEIVQQETTAHMIHSPTKVVSYLSQYFTLLPGDLVFMGTPGRTKSLQHNDVVSVTIEQVGTVENRIQQQN